MDDNWRMAIGYICVMFVAITFMIGISWVMSPSEFTFKIEMDDNTKEAIDSIDYPIVDQNEIYIGSCLLNSSEYWEKQMEVMGYELLNDSFVEVDE